MARWQFFGPSISGMCMKMKRMKKFEDDTMCTPPKRCLTTFDITLLGVGHMVGAGIYVLAGLVARCTAGPGVILSFLFAGFSSLLSALCYAEIGAKMPMARSVYTCTYAAVGEFWAFVVGWNTILAHMMGAASVARAWAGYLDYLTDYFLSVLKFIFFYVIRADRLISMWRFNDLPDPLAAGLITTYTFFLACGMKIPTTVKSILTVVNLVVMALVIVIGFNYDNTDNWSQKNGGFLPLGMGGVLAGAATCFYAFIGFDSIVASGAEAKDPGNSIPRATVFSISIVTVGYVLVGGTLTLMVPYDKIDPKAALPDVFAANGVSWARYIISIGAVCGITRTFLTSLFSSSQMMFAMASDGLLFSFMGRINAIIDVPYANLTISCCLSALLAFIIDIQDLVEFMLISTAVTYTIVVSSVIILRYRPGSVGVSVPQAGAGTPRKVTSPTTSAVYDGDDNIPQSGLLDYEETGKLRRRSIWLRHVIGNWEPGTVVATAVFIYTASCGGFNILVFFGPPEWWTLALEIYFGLMMGTCLVTIMEHQQCPPTGKFRVPLVPLVPAISVFLNISLMCYLSSMTWILFLSWMLVGMCVYFLYGICHSKEASGESCHLVLMSPSEAERASIKPNSAQ